MEEEKIRKEISDCVTNSKHLVKSVVRFERVILW